MYVLDGFHVNELVLDYQRAQFLKKLDLMFGKAVFQNPAINAVLAGHLNTTISVPVLKGIQGDAELWDTSTVATASQLGTTEEKSPVLSRIKAVSFHDLNELSVGEDLDAYIASMVGNFWAEQTKKSLINILVGVMGVSDLSNHALDITGASGSKLAAEHIIKVKQRALGDFGQKFSTIVMHSATFAELQKQQLIQTVFPSDAKEAFNTYLGLTVVVDDDCPAKEVTRDEEKFMEYSTFLLTDGAFQRGDKALSADEAFERERQGSASKNVLLTRNVSVLHPVGMNFKKSLSTFCTENELAVSNNWELARDDKEVGIAVIYHRNEETAAVSKKKA